MKPTAAHSFPGAEVVVWTLSDTLLELEVSDVLFEGKSRGHAKMTFPLVRRATAMSYHVANGWIEETTVECLKDLREFHFKAEEHYSLKGFGVDSGKLLAVGILSNDAEIVW